MQKNDWYVWCMCYFNAYLICVGTVGVHVGVCLVKKYCHSYHKNFQNMWYFLGKVWFYHYFGSTEMGFNFFLNFFWVKYCILYLQRIAFFTFLKITHYHCVSKNFQAFFHGRFVEKPFQKFWKFDKNRRCWLKMWFIGQICFFLKKKYMSV